MLTNLPADYFCQLVRVHRVNVVDVKLHVEVGGGVVGHVALHGKVHGVEYVFPARRLTEDRADGYLELGPGGWRVGKHD